MLENPQTERVATTENPFTPPTEGQASVGMQENDPSQAYDFTYVPTIARIALYDDLRSAPRITEIQPATTAEYIENLASKIYEQAKLAGGTIPYTVIREVTEIIVSILDQGNTIRFADQGPGINQKEKAQLPGFTSAIEPMKRYIRGVGSGLPIVREYLDYSHGTISIEDNLGTGAVVTISLSSEDAGPTNAIAATPQTNRGQAARPVPLAPPLSQREREFLPFFLGEGALGVTDLVNLTGAAPSSTYTTLKKMEEAGLIEKTVGQKRILTDFGFQVANSL